MKKEKPCLETGMTAETQTTVTDAQTAQQMGSGRSPVLATPALVALMEGTAQKIIDANIPDGWESVGTGIQLTHDAMTPVGMTVTVRAELIGFDGKTAEFDVSAKDGQREVARGRHRRMLARTRTLARMLRQKP